MYTLYVLHMFHGYVCCLLSCNFSLAVKNIVGKSFDSLFTLEMSGVTCMLALLRTEE